MSDNSDAQLSEVRCCWPSAGRYGVSKEGDKRLTMLSKGLAKAGIDFRPESYKWSVVQALLSRGDRRITPLLLRVREYGDSAGSFRRAFKVWWPRIPCFHRTPSSTQQSQAMYCSISPAWLSKAGGGAQRAMTGRRVALIATACCRLAGDGRGAAADGVLRAPHAPPR